MKSMRVTRVLAIVLGFKQCIPYFFLNSETAVMPTKA